MVADLATLPKTLDIPGCVPTRTRAQMDAWYESIKEKMPDLYASHIRSKAEAIAWNAYIQTPLGKARQAEAQRIWDEPEPEIDAAIAAIMYPNQKADRAILGLDATAIYQKREVRNAYRRKARKLHPDVGGDAEAFKQLHRAYRAVLAIAKNE